MFGEINVQYRFNYKPERLVLITDVSSTGDIVNLDYWTSPGFSSLQPGPMIKGDRRTPNPWSFFKHNVEYIHGTYRRSNPVGSRTQVGTILEASGAVTYNSSRNRTLAYNTALADLLSTLDKGLNLAVSAAEAGQTVKMLNLVQVYTGIVTDMKRSWKRELADKMRKFKSRRSVKRAMRNWQRGVKLRHPRYYRSRPIDEGLVQSASLAAANGYLMYTYGLMPLISDIRGIAENLVGWSREIAVAKGSGASSFKLDQRSIVAIDGRNHVGTCQRSGFVACKLKVRARTRFDTDYSKWSSMNPLLIGYELLPYSFVFDWVLDLGSYMANLEKSIVLGADFRDGYASFIEVNRCRTVYRTRVKNNGTFQLEASGFDEQVSFDRSLLLSFPKPAFPRISPDLGSRRLLSAASLLRQLILK